MTTAKEDTFWICNRCGMRWYYLLDPHHVCQGQPEEYTNKLLAEVVNRLAKIEELLRGKDPDASGRLPQADD